MIKSFKGSSLEDMSEEWETGKQCSGNKPVQVKPRIGHGKLNVVAKCRLK